MIFLDREALPSDNYKELTPLGEACEKLQEQAYYSIEVQLYDTNVPHGALLYTGFKTGQYRSIFTGTYHLTDINCNWKTTRIKVLNLIPEISESSR